MKNMRRIAAWIGIVILVSVYLAACIMGFMGSDKTPGMFTAALVLSVLVPVAFYAVSAASRIIGSDTASVNDNDDAEASHASGSSKKADSAKPEKK